MKHLLIQTPLTLAQLHQRFGAEPASGWDEFWVSPDGQHALAESSQSLISLRYIPGGIKLSARYGTRLPDLGEWIQAQTVPSPQFENTGAPLAGAVPVLGLKHLPDAEDLDLLPDINSETEMNGVLQAQDLFLNPEFLAQGWQALFPGHQALNLEIGCGYAHFLAWLAPRHPEQAFVGLDIVSKVLKRAIRRLARSQVGNARLAKLDALHTLRELVAPASLDHLYILFPDPWPKNIRRRTLREDSLKLFASRLKAGGRLLFVSDDPDYAADAKALLSACPWFEATDFPLIEVRTKYEKKWLAQEKSITRLAFARMASTEWPDQGQWPGYAVNDSWQMPDWKIGRLDQIAAGFEPILLPGEQLSLRLQSCYRAATRSALRMRAILAPHGSLAQHAWLELDALGRLAPAKGSFIPFLRQRQHILSLFGQHLAAIAD
ncbi:MAG: hypothetical protein CVV27_19755 [Candidatus Melainabacteria bacterium HGW-Melainabacteria-1]|nr:MAG: hypothetical protein CVV27_19755 [Candidatus Melainabacteria bacterium HGW-Melainabacteria-1]